MALSVSIVALPLGNVGDLSPRAAAELARADRIFCEDTRKTRDLLKRAGIECRARLISLPGDSERSHNWAREAEGADAETWALVSDAGTPVVNDPGSGLIDFCRKHEIAVRALPGPCAPVLAWQWSGGFGLPFVFAGFAPKARTPGTKDLSLFFGALDTSATFAFFDTKHQFEVTLEHLEQAGFAARRLFVAREMTKSHEELIAGSVSECLAALRDRRDAQGGALGELTFLLEGGRREAGATLVALEELARLRAAPTKEAARIAAKLTGLAVRDCYSAFLNDPLE